MFNKKYDINYFENLIGIKLTNQQKIQLQYKSNILPKYIPYRQNGKTFTHFNNFLEYLKSITNSKHEIEFYNSMQEELAEMHKNLVLSYWK